MDSNILPDFHLPTEIYIKQNILKNIDSIVSKHGKRIVIVTTLRDFEIYSEILSKLHQSLKAQNFGCILYNELPAKPSTEDIDIAVSFIKKTNSDLIIGFGEVKSLNSAKAIALLSSNHIFCHDVFNEKKIFNPPINLITIPTYPTFGFEISPVFYINEKDQMINKVYSNNILYPKATIVDPELSMLMPEKKILNASISSMAIAIESIISTRNNDIINTYALKSITLIFKNLPLIHKDPQKIFPRVQLSTASIMSGISFSVAFLSLTLAMALAISSITSIDVDNAISLMIPHIMEFHLTTSPEEYVQMSRVMGEDVANMTIIEAAIKAIEAVRKLEIDAKINQRLSHYNIPQNKFKEIADLAITYPFLSNTPRPLSANELETILIAAY